MRGLVFSAIAALSAFTVSSAALANHKPHEKARYAWQKPKLRADRECIPYNGPYGYYGNPWCDTGSSRPPDVEFRENHRTRRSLSID